jgi:hypothetical protein
MFRGFVDTIRDEDKPSLRHVLVNIAGAGAKVLKSATGKENGFEIVARDIDPSLVGLSVADDLTDIANKMVVDTLTDRFKKLSPEEYIKDISGMIHGDGKFNNIDFKFLDGNPMSAASRKGVEDTAKKIYDEMRSRVNAYGLGKRQGAAR